MIIDGQNNSMNKENVCETKKNGKKKKKNDKKLQFFLGKKRKENGSLNK